LENALSKGCELPPSVLSLIRRVRDLNQSVPVGFRRRNLAALLFRYFRDMGSVLGEMARVLRPGGHCVVIIGNNHTVAGRQLVDIPTDGLLVDIAANKGLRLWKSLDMTDQPAYLPHSQNGIRSETILFFHR
jgi:site-specific DNA-methyltransferase (cytosine-N4-specific)